MMSRIWFGILAVMIFGNILKYAFVNVLGWVIIDLAVLLVCYLILKRQPFINLKQTMLFLSGLTLVNILVDLRILNAVAGNLALLAIIAWMVFGGNFRLNNYNYKYSSAPRRKHHK